MKKIEHKFIDNIEYKYCSRCATWHLLSMFSNCKNTWDKLATFCKQCAVLVARESIQRNKEKVREYQKIFRNTMSEEQKEKRRKSNRKYIASLSATERSLLNKRYRENKKKKYGISYFLNNAISERLRYGLQIQGISKGFSHWENYVDWTLQDLKDSLELKFLEGMSWENYGRSCGKGVWWEIDHKIPQTWFSFSSVEDSEFKQCWNLTNLQPKWERENKSKGNRYVG